jgi:hypothetical protein
VVIPSIDRHGDGLTAARTGTGRRALRRTGGPGTAGSITNTGVQTPRPLVDREKGIPLILVADYRNPAVADDGNFRKNRGVVDFELRRRDRTLFQTHTGLGTELLDLRGNLVRNLIVFRRNVAAVGVTPCFTN